MVRALPALTDTQTPSVVAVSLVLAMLVSWPNSAAQADDEPAFDEEIVVTGSRIRRDPLDARDSVLTMDADDRDRSGITSLGNMLARLSVSGSPLTTRFNSSGNFGFPADGGGVAAGASQVDLRHLGSKRVLVLVDGVRWVNGSSGSGVSGATDLNTIPTGVIERVEVLRDGASAIYGSDAIAGVVNVITRRTNGFAASVYGGGYDAGGETSDIELSLGGERGATSASVHLTHTDQKRVSAADHELTRWPKPGTGVTHGSTFTPQGRIIFVDPNTDTFVNCALNDGVSGIPVYDPADPCGPGDDYHPWTNADRFNYSPYNLALTPSTRTGAFARLEHRASERLRVYARAFLNRRESINQAAPEPLWAGTLAEAGSVMDTIVIHGANPYNPFGFDVGPGALVTRRPLESGPRVFRQDVATRHVAAGARGERTMLQRPLYWEVNFAWSRNAADQTKRGAHNARKMLQALGDPDACAATPGCVPLNLMGGQGNGSGTITPAMLDWIGFVQHDASEQELKSFTFNVTGDLAEFRAGPLAFAAGMERRTQRGRFDPDPVVSAGDTAGVSAQPTAGGFRVTEWYGEVEAPLVAGARGADLIDVSAAIRYFDYNTFDSGNTAKIGMRWRPTPHLLFRTTWTEGFRAPNIGELFGGLTQFHAVISDPCASFLATNVGQTVIDNCIAAGVPADGSYTQLGSQISVLTGGNELLEPETSESVTLSLAWRPGWALDLDWIDDLRFELTRYDHEVDHAITGYDAQAMLDGCYRDRVDAFCRLIQRNDRGGIAGFRNTLFNVGAIQTNGWDFGITLGAPSGWRLQWHGTYLAEYSELLKDTEGTVIETRSLAGQTQADRGKPAWKSTLAADWTRARWNASWTVRYIHGMAERCSDFLDGTPDSLTNLGLCSMPDHQDNTASRNHLASTTYHDAQATYTLPRPNADVVLALGANNLLDRDPPASQSASINGYDASVYDIPGGRFVYFRVSYATNR